MPPKKGKAKVETDGALEALLDGVRSLYEEHRKKIEEFGHENGDVDDITFKVKIDRSKAQPDIDVKISFTSKVSDDKSYQVTDPSQGTFELLTKETKEASKKQRKAIESEESEVD